MTVERLHRAVGEAFTRLRLPAVDDGLGGWRLAIPAAAGRPVLALTAVPGAGGRVLALRVEPAAAFPAALRHPLLDAANQWHQLQRWPRLVVRDAVGVLVVEADAHVVVAAADLDGGLRGGEGIVGAIAAFVSGSLDFWEVLGLPVDERSVADAVGRIVARGRTR